MAEALAQSGATGCQSLSEHEQSYWQAHVSCCSSSGLIPKTLRDLCMHAHCHPLRAHAHEVTTLIGPEEQQDTLWCLGRRAAHQ